LPATFPPDAAAAIATCDSQGRRRPVRPCGNHHSVKNTSSGNGAELATYVVEKGKPLITLVK
jgi:hypothetical protein